MTTEQIAITLLAGVLVNIFTGFLTYLWTTRRDQAKHAEDTKSANARVADIAVSHLYTSYMQSKRLRVDVLSHVGNAKSETYSNEVFSTVLDGIARSLEQERLSIVPNIMSWRAFVIPGSYSDLLIEKVQEVDFWLPGSETSKPTQIRLDEKNVPLKTMRQDGPASDGNEVVPRAKQARKPMKDVARSLTESPMATAARALFSGDVDGIRGVKARLSDLTSRGEKLVVGATLAITGDRAGVELLQDVLVGEWADLDPDEFSMALGSIVQGASRLDSEAETLSEIEDTVLKRLESDSDSSKKKAFNLNQLQKLRYAVGDYVGATRDLERVLSWEPDDPSYWYNFGLCAEKTGDDHSLTAAVDRLGNLADKDAEHLSLIARTIRKSGEIERSNELLEQVRAIDPLQALFLETKFKEFDGESVQVTQS